MVTLDNGGAARRGVILLRPPADLRPDVRLVWVERQGPDTRARRGAWRIVPDLCTHLVYARLAVDGRIRSRLRLVGPRAVHLDIDKRPRVMTIGLRLAPGALPSLFGIRSCELVDSAVDADLALSGRSLELARSIEVTARPAEVVTALLAIARGLVDRDARRDPRVRRALPAVERSRRSNREIAADLGVTPRTWRRLAREWIGLPPSRAMRIARLHRALRAAVARPPAWARLAIACGWADQSHMIRDFRELVGETPVGFLRRATEPDVRNVQDSDPRG